MDRLRCSNIHVIFVFFLLALLLTGCATIPMPTRSVRIGETGPLGICADFFASLDQRVEKAGVLKYG